MTRKKDLAVWPKIWPTLKDAVGRSTVVITVIIIAIIIVAVVIIHFSSHAPVNLFWFAACMVYVALGCFNFGFATRLLPIGISPAGKPLIMSSKEEISRMKKKVESRYSELNNRPKLYDNEEFELQRLAGEMMFWNQMENARKQAVSISTTLQNVENLANRFNQSAKVNRNVLYVAGVSFFVAAVLSFVQAL